MTEELARIRAKRAGNRTVITKRTKEADFEVAGTSHQHKPITDDRDDVGRKNQEGLEEQILALCEVGKVEKEIENSDEIFSCVLDIQRCISQQISVAAVGNAPLKTNTIVHEFMSSGSGLNQ